MFKGTTPTHTFEVDIDTSLIKEVKITYSQNDREVLIKKTCDCTIKNGIITTQLSQENTFLFECLTPVTIQVRVLTLGGEALTSDLIKEPVGKCLDAEVLE